MDERGEEIVKAKYFGIKVILVGESEDRTRMR